MAGDALLTIPTGALQPAARLSVSLTTASTPTCPVITGYMGDPPSASQVDAPIADGPMDILDTKRVANEALDRYAKKLAAGLGCPVLVGGTPHVPPGSAGLWIEKLDTIRMAGRLDAASGSQMFDCASTKAHIRAQRAQADLVASIRSEWDNLPDAEPEGIVLRPR
jgi:hypothetical protein